MNPIQEAQLRQQITQAVYDGAKKEQVFQTLAANGITGREAEEWFRRGRQEWVAEVRGVGVRKALKGLGLIAAGVGLHFFTAYTLRRTWVYFWLLVIWGAWWVLTGTLEAALASKKSNAIDPENAH